MKDRIKLIRHTVGLTQQKFADRLGIKGNAISQYESGRNAPIDAVISLICREFKVNEAWLRTGKGEMFDQTEETIIERLCSELHASDLEAKIIRAYFRLDPRIREPFMNRLLTELQSESTAPVVDAKITPTNPDTAGQDRTEPDIMARLAELERQNQELTAEIAAMKEEDALLGLTDVFSASPSVSVGNIRPAEKAKK